MSIRLFLATLVLAVTPIALAQDARPKAYYSRPDDAAGCIGGERCGGARAKLRIGIDETRPVTEITFEADADVGSRARGELRVAIDGEVVEYGIRVGREDDTYVISVPSIRGREVVFTATDEDEVNIRDVRVTYGRTSADRIPPRSPSGRDWMTYDGYGACIGGQQCRRSGREIRVPLEKMPVQRIRFRAHDDIGGQANGKLDVFLGARQIATNLDVPRDGRSFELDAGGEMATHLLLRVASDDEVEVSAIEVLYARSSRSGGSKIGRGPVVDEQCIGGDRCGGRGAEIRLSLEPRRIREIRFRAHDDVGSSSKGELRITVDGQVLERDLDIQKSGEEYRIDGRGMRGRVLLIQPDADDEVVVTDLEIIYER